MQIRFNVLCHTQWGEQVYILGSTPELGEWNTDRALKTTYSPGDLWKTEIIFTDQETTTFEYRYIIKNDAGTSLHEETCNRRSPDIICISETPVCLDILDSWNNPSDPDSVFLTAPFVKTMFSRSGYRDSTAHYKETASRSPGIMIHLRLINPLVMENDTVHVTGSIPALGKWDIEGTQPMDGTSFPVWTLNQWVEDKNFSFDYKYIIKDKDGKVVAREEEERHIAMTADAIAPDHGQFVNQVVVTDNKFIYAAKWRGAGIAIPVFSIRSEKGLGVGEFLDLKGLADWASAAGFHLIQMLPVNDTLATMDGLDFCPYSCISIFALHPIYINLEAIGPLSDAVLKEIDIHRTRLNQSPILKHLEVMAIKLSLLRQIFETKKGLFLSSPEFQAFLEEHGHWLRPYAAFCALRDQYGTSDFRKWPRHRHLKKDEIIALTNPGSEHYETAAFYCFVQHHLHNQLLEASRYAQGKGIILKGDIPIGIQKGSDSCWAHPEFFHMDQSTGAPPDPFSDSGQNWGFPTYNWGEMALDNYSWWQRRMGHMSSYFQMIRLDHVLGFFRIWEIPDHSMSALLGHFNPAIPLWRNEFEKQGIWDFNRLCDPYIPDRLVQEMFGEDALMVAAEYLDEYPPGQFSIKPGFTTQRQVEEHLSLPVDNTPAALQERYAKIKNGLFTLIADIVLFRDPVKDGFHPRINMLDTASFNALEGWMKETLHHLYNEYFYNRQETFWRKQAMVKLPVLKKVSNMLICGEDLGMIPDCVPKVMEDLCLLGLRIQRMPKEPGREFGYPREYKYLTVCTTSSHDMSTIRGWWEEDRARTERFFHTILGRNNEPPVECEPTICEEIITQHLESPSMWAVFPIQDILAMSSRLRRPGDPQEEQINNPADPFNKWGFRLHISLEQLLSEREFSGKLRQMVWDSGRSRPY
ncbi:MAG: 4-alpha-glucanotransferase [Syntrophus sp. (in: bacteria)]|nr:4-alpha-glucanotransferase [Syntrophus sp. (in: bacteria)]